MAGLASHLEGDAIGSSVLELECGGRKVVEIFVEELQCSTKERVMLALIILAETRASNC